MARTYKASGTLKRVLFRGLRGVIDIGAVFRIISVTIKRMMVFGRRVQDFSVLEGLEFRVLGCELVELFGFRV